MPTSKEKKFFTKKMDLREHDARLRSASSQKNSLPLGWVLAFAFLAGAIALLYFQR
ncbi:MAG: hypothetical protein V4498_05025 [candidate division FCPU426 bacterium]